MPQSFRKRPSIRRRFLVLAAAAFAAVLAIGWLTFELTLGSAITHAGQQADRRLALFDRTLAAIIDRYHYLPSSLALAAEARAVLENPDDPETREAANGYLSRLNNNAGASELFIMAPNGEVIAASNWWAYDSFVGENLGYRPYFEQAMRDGAAKFYAIGNVTGVAGYFLARRIDGPQGPLGVAVTKINLGEIEANWWLSGELIVIVDDNNVVILSTRPDWRYRPLAELGPDHQQRINAERRYGDGALLANPISVDQWRSGNTRFAELGGGDPDTQGAFLVDELRLPTHRWQLVSFTPTAPLVRSATIAGAAAALAAAALLLLAVLVVQRRRLVAQRLAEHDRLERRVAERTEDLHILNEALRAEIAERIKAEKAQQEAHYGLVQAAKLASLGQALAGVAHEISQPVAALTTHLASARLLAAQHAEPVILTTLTTMDKVVDRLAALTAHLKTFSRKQTGGAASEADLAQVIADALDLLDHRLKALRIDVEQTQPLGPLTVRGNPVHLEQVLINLLSNAADAMERSVLRVLTIRVSCEDDYVTLLVGDTGEGIAPSALRNVFDPFYSTKDAGRGLGLGLSISSGLVRDIGGNITVQSRPGEGSTFAVRLPLATHVLPIMEAAQ